MNTISPLNRLKLTLIVSYACQLILLIWLSFSVPLIFFSACGLLLLGFFAGILLPAIILSWTILISIAAGGALLMWQSVYLPFYETFALLAAFPIAAGSSAIICGNLRFVGILNQQQAQIKRFANHYDPLTKLHTKYNAAKFYHKCLKSITALSSLNASMEVTLIKWQGAKQVKQFRHQAFLQHTASIANFLKHHRLPAEALFVVDEATFLIISPAVVAEHFEFINHKTQQYINQQASFSHHFQAKFAHLHIDNTNVAAYQHFDQLMHKLNRSLEYDIAVEYCRDTPSTTDTPK